MLGSDTIYCSNFEAQLVIALGDVRLRLLADTALQNGMVRTGRLIRDALAESGVEPDDDAIMTVSLTMNKIIVLGVASAANKVAAIRYDQGTNAIYALYEI